MANCKLHTTENIYSSASQLLKSLFALIILCIDPHVHYINVAHGQGSSTCDPHACAHCTCIYFLVYDIRIGFALI